jgi:LPXTG-motif cell wall-anchored protein
VFATMRRKNRSAKMKSELGQSVDHFKRAASLAAQETSATVGPRFYAARDRVQPTASKAKDAASSSWGSAVATLTPLVTAATEKAQQVSKSTAQTSKKDVKAGKKNAKKLQKRADKTLGRKQKSRTGSKLGGLLLAGAAVGAAGAFVLRKRRQEQWDEYDPSPATTRLTGSDEATAKPADLSGPSGFVTPKGETGPVLGAVGSDPAAGAVGVDPTVGAGTPEPAIELVDADPVDQTQSAQHSPKVARLASGGQKKN